MADQIRRVETTHIDEVARSARSTTQWFAEKRHASHPITHNNKLKVFICGEEGFSDIQTQIESAKDSIDLICWGFDPGMELKRGAGLTWPRGKTYGDLLVEAAKRGVMVRLLVWYDIKLGMITKNMPGYTHGIFPWWTRSRFYGEDKIDSQHSLAMLKAKAKDVHNYIHGKITPQMIPLVAREEYCYGWYDAAMHGRLGGIQVRTRNTDLGNIKHSLSSETHQPASMSTSEIERLGLLHFPTHHQKTVLIDFMHDEGSKALGYVMGLNSVTDYWDTCSHQIEDPRREQGAGLTAGESVQGKEMDAGFLSVKPYQDYACRIIGGKALIALYNNFATAWDRSIDDQMHTAASACMKRFGGTCKAPPAALLRKAEPGDSTVQIVRTQPDEADKSIKDIYCLATDAACLAGGYLYIENQYFQNEEWAQRLIQKRKEVVAAWKRGAEKTGKSLKEMPILHVFIVVPAPERSQMIPSTHDTLSVLGEAGGMTGQNKMIEDTNKSKKEYISRDGRGIPRTVAAPVGQVVKHANEMEKRNSIQLEEDFGLKVSAAMLQVCGYDQRRWRYREIYIHSKLLLVDDCFMTLGSANLNQRSMAVDSELNIATNDASIARGLRNRVWMQHSGNLISGGGGSQVEIARAFNDWIRLMQANKNQKHNGQKMTGFLLPLEDKRSSTLRLG